MISIQKEKQKIKKINLYFAHKICNYRKKLESIFLFEILKKKKKSAVDALYMNIMPVGINTTGAKGMAEICR